MSRMIEIICKKIGQRIKARPYLWTVLISLLGLIIVPLLIWIAFWYGDNYRIVINTSLTVGDALGFYASILASVATGALGIIAVMQNNRLQKLEMDIAAKNNSCSVYIENSQAHIATRLSNDSEQPYKESGNYVQLLVTNHSESFLKKIQIQFNDHIFSSHLTLIKGDPKNIKIFLPHDFNANTLPICKVIFTSCYDVNTYADFQLVIKADPYRPETRYYHFYGTSVRYDI